jgi:four helix bundle protein
VRDFHGLKVWSKAHNLVLAAYGATAAFPESERFGLTAQMRRSCSSIATNIAEGCGRDGKPELRRFLSIARGSASELEYQLLLARSKER